MPDDPRDPAPAERPPARLDPPRLVESAAGLAELRATLEDAAVVAVDTESNSMHAYRERVCLLQFTVNDQDWVVDPLAVDAGALGGLFEDPRREKIFHAAEYDVICLRREFGWETRGVFDTMVAARVLGWPRFGLGALLETHFDVRLDKKMQRHDWGRRPLSHAAISYARLDTHFLHALREQQIAALAQLERLDEARAAFARAAASRPSDRPYDLEGYWRIKGARALPPAGASALRALWRWRDETARRLDRPHFKVASDAALLALAAALPTDAATLRAVAGLPPALARRHGPALLGTLRASAGEAPPEPPPTGKTAPTAADRRLDALLTWRKGVASTRGLETDVIVTRRALRAVAEASPPDPEALAGTGALDAWQLEHYGPGILAALAAHETSHEGPHGRG